MPSSRATSSPRKSASRVGRSVEPEREESVRDTLRLIFVHELRGELGLDDARSLALLGPIDQLLAARQTGDRERRESLDRLRSLADDDSASPEALSVLVKGALEADRSAEASLVAAQRGVLTMLSPREGCQFILLEQRFIGQARRQIRDARTLRDRSRGAERPVGRSAPGGGERR